MITTTFRHVCISKLEIFESRIGDAISNLTDEQIWWRPNHNALSIGMILQHLNGNVTQWIISALGDEADVRNRKEEFNDSVQMPKQQLYQNLQHTVNKACDIIDGIGDIELNDHIVVQGFHLTKFEALFDVVEHFSWHTGQIVYIAKLIKGAGHGISFYDNEKLNVSRNEI